MLAPLLGVVALAVVWIVFKDLISRRHPVKSWVHAEAFHAPGNDTFAVVTEKMTSQRVDVLLGSTQDIRDNVFRVYLCAESDSGFRQVALHHLKRQGAGALTAIGWDARGGFCYTTSEDDGTAGLYRVGADGSRQALGEYPPVGSQASRRMIDVGPGVGLRPYQVGVAPQGAYAFDPILAVDSVSGELVPLRPTTGTRAGPGGD